MIAGIFLNYDTCDRRLGAQNPQFLGSRFVNSSQIAYRPVVRQCVDNSKHVRTWNPFA